MYERGMCVPMDNPLRATVETEAPRNKKGQPRLQMKAWREVGRLYSDEAGLDALPREQLLVTAGKASMVCITRKSHLQTG